MAGTLVLLEAFFLFFSLPISFHSVPVSGLVDSFQVLQRWLASDQQKQETSYHLVWATALPP